MIVSKPSIGLQPRIDRESVKKVLNKTEIGKAPGNSGVVLGMLLASLELSMKQITNISNQIIAKNKAPDNWDTSVFLN